MLRLAILTVLAAAAYGSGLERPAVHLNNTHLWIPKIIGGADANEGEYPYIVSLNYQGDGHACGASVLTPDWVLTAAHCCLTGNPMEIYAGSIYLSGGGTKYQIRQYIINGDYNPDSHWKNDICLINLASPIQYNNNVQPAKLPPRDLNINSGDSLVIPGWGSLSNGQGPDRLQVLRDDKALTNDECISRTGVDIHPGQLCTLAGQNYAVCSGDSGGPLTRNGVQVGITSWVYLPCGSGMPDVFTRVSYYVDWISQVLGKSANELRFATPEDLL